MFNYKGEYLRIGSLDNTFFQISHSAVTVLYTYYIKPVMERIVLEAFEKDSIIAWHFLILTSINLILIIPIVYFHMKYGAKVFMITYAIYAPIILITDPTGIGYDETSAFSDIVYSLVVWIWFIDIIALPIYATYRFFKWYRIVRKKLFKIT